MILAEKIDLNDKKRLSLQQTSVLFFSCVAAIVLLALLTYHPNDPGLFVHDKNAGVQNKAGSAGAFLADILVGFFGYLSYIVPLAFLVLGFSLARKSAIDLKGINLWLALLGVFLALLSGCGLATLLWPESEMIYKAGGLLGLAVAKIFTFMLGHFGAILLLFGGFFAGITLIADISWVKIIDYVGDKVLDAFDYLFGDESSDKKADKKPSLINKIGASAVGVAGAAASLPALLKKKKTESKKSSNDVPVVTNKVDGGNSKEEKLGISEEILNLEATKNTSDDTSATKVDSSEKVEKPSKKKASGTKKMLLLPSVQLLNTAPEGQSKSSSEDIAALNEVSEKIITSLQDYGVHGVTVESQQPGPIVTRFELQLPAGTKVSKITGLAKDLARNMGVISVRIVEVIPGKTTIGIEVPNAKRDLVVIRDIIDSKEFKEAESPLTLVLGKSIGGKAVVADLSKMPHLLVAGTTGSGKSVAVNAMLMSLLYKSTPEQVKLILIDPKMLELSTYEGIPHLLTPVVTDMKDAANALRWCVGEMERRYAMMSHVKVRSIAGYNEKVAEAIKNGKPIMDPSYDPTKHVDTQPKILEPLPYIVVVIDEFADMVMVVGKKVEELIARLAQKARASGIHLVLATQRPSVDVITGLIKANIPSRIAFQVSTKIDSRTVLDQGGAEQLLGLGDMLYLPPGTGLPQRVHGAFVADQEVENVVNYIKSQGEPEYLTDVLKDTGGAKGAIPGLEPLADREGDALYDEAVAIVTESRRASISYLQRRLKIGYNRAATMIEEMEAAGIVSPVQSKGTREVLAPEPVAN
ncbi:MAG TPA: DNA translocase FtsK [Gammaproteobacteria bacterium]|nr:DNA translocase FtsK [Gammaproteobacteria bacterium]